MHKSSMQYCGFYAFPLTRSSIFLNPSVYVLTSTVIIHLLHFPPKQLPPMKAQFLSDIKLQNVLHSLTPDISFGPYLARSVGGTTVLCVSYSVTHFDSPLVVQQLRLAHFLNLSVQPLDKGHIYNCNAISSAFSYKMGPLIPIFKNNCQQNHFKAQPQFSHLMMFLVLSFLAVQRRLASTVLICLL